MYGDKCWFAHTLHPEAAEQKLEYSTECCICQEDVLKAGKRFGLMQSGRFISGRLQTAATCSAWNASGTGDIRTSATRTCVAARSAERPHFTSSPARSRFSTRKRSRRSSRRTRRICRVGIAGIREVEIPCKYFNGGLGVCPFGESCFYSHKLANGQEFTPRIVMQGDGELRDIGYVGMEMRWHVVVLPGRVPRADRREG